MARVCAGYRIMSKVGHHRVSLKGTKLVLEQDRKRVRRLFRDLSAKGDILSLTPSPT